MTDFQETEASSAAIHAMTVEGGRSINKSPLFLFFIIISSAEYPSPLLLIHLNGGKSIVMIMFYLEKLLAIKIVGSLMFVFRSFVLFYTIQIKTAWMDLLLCDCELKIDE